MSINSLCDDLLINIMLYLEDNYSSINYSLTCKYTNTLFSKKGFLKKLEVNNNSDIMKIMYLISKHSNTLNLLTVRNVSNPHLFLPKKCCKKVVFIYCSFSSSISLENSEVQVLEIIGLTNKQTKTIKINVGKFSKLKVLNITEYDYQIKKFDLSNIPKNVVCKKVLLN